MSYVERRDEIAAYFDRTAFEAWAKLTSDAKVSRVRASVRAGRDAMRATLLGMLPADLSGARLLDAGCGTGALALEAARRGAAVVAVDISPTLIGLARERASQGPDAARIDFRAGDMLDPVLGRFDFVVAMDSLIHYRAADIAAAVAGLAARTERAIAFTVAPRTPLLSLKWGIGKLFPRSDRSPAIEPVTPRALAAALAAHAEMAPWRQERTGRISTGFYVSEAILFANGSAH